MIGCYPVTSVTSVVDDQVQPDAEDVGYGTARMQRGKLLYSLEYDATKSEVRLFTYRLHPHGHTGV